MYNNLPKFIVRAKKEALQDKEKLLVPSRFNSQEIYLDKGRYKYLNSFYGNTSYAGQEVVFFDNKPIWAMNYYGRLLSLNDYLSFDEFLRESLMYINEDRPFRGPSKFAKGDYRYLCNVYGTLEFFDGKEMVFYKNKGVYELTFNGGELK